MSKQVGALIKEARVSAGMTQKQLAEAVDGLSASSISKAERGIKKLTPEQLQQIAEATGTSYESFLIDEDDSVTCETESEAAVAETTDAPAVAEIKEEPAEAETKEEKQPGQNPMAMLAAMMGSMMGGGENGENPMAAMMGGEGGEGQNPMAMLAGMMSSFMGQGTGMNQNAKQGEEQADCQCEEQGEEQADCQCEEQNEEQGE